MGLLHSCNPQITEMILALKYFLTFILSCLLDAGAKGGAMLHSKYVEIRGQPGSLFSPSTMWALRIKSKIVNLGSIACIHRAILLALY